MNTANLVVLAVALCASLAVVVTLQARTRSSVDGGKGGGGDDPDQVALSCATGALSFGANCRVECGAGEFAASCVEEIGEDYVPVYHARCAACAAGMYDKYPHMTCDACAKCPINTYSEGGAVWCTACPDNSWSEAGAASTDECVCNDGFVKNDDGQCVEKGATRVADGDSDTDGDDDHRSSPGMVVPVLFAVGGVCLGLAVAILFVRCRKE